MIRFHKTIIGIFALFSLGFFAVALPASAATDLFGGEEANINANIGLTTVAPQVIIARLINVTLGLVGIIFLVLVVYGGYLWMTSAGDATKIEKAKKLLMAAVIGLVLTLSSWAIARYIINQLNGSIGPGSASCTVGQVAACACGTKTCDAAGNWDMAGCTPCGAGGPGSSCDGNTLTAFDPGNAIATCEPGGTCNPGLVCDQGTATSTCTCVSAGGGLGAACNGTTTPAMCVPAPSKCDPLLLCAPAGDPDECTCIGAPVIDWVSPKNATGNPVGTSTNFMTIGGRFLGSTTGQVKFFDGATTSIVAQFPSTVNAACGGTWSEDQIIVIIPAGAKDGPIQVVRADAQEDTTNNTRGAAIPDFKNDNLIRPGLCSSKNTTVGSTCIGLSCGYFNENFNLQGIHFNGAGRTILIGGTTGSTSASGIVWGGTNLFADATVPDLTPAKTRVFLRADGRYSNELNFEVFLNNSHRPHIDYIDPGSAHRSDYVTIYGSNFGAKPGQVTFNPGAFPADVSFPPGCENYWHDTYIIVKVAPTAQLGANQVTVTTAAPAQTSDPADFTVNAGAAGPGICSIKPHNGDVGQEVNVIGERFGTWGGSAATEFFNVVQSTTTASTNWNPGNNGKIKTDVPTGAETGPFKVINTAGTKSNALNFMVGKCTQDSQCDVPGGEKCCVSGTKDGLCDTDCGSTGVTTNNMFGWDFFTGSTTPPQTCAGYTDAAQCLAAASCPNSPGQCSTKAAGSLGTCNNASCDTLSPLCAGGLCTYNATANKCLLTGSTCDTASSTILAGHQAVCNKVGSSNYWQIVEDGSCPAGSFKDINGFCTVGSIGSPLACSTCQAGLTCQSGQCYANAEVCPAGSSCQAGQCLADDATCECCCRVGDNPVTSKPYAEQDCCLGLSCSGTCGSDTNASDNTGFGQCTGCTITIGGVVDQAASDAACNCAGHTLKYCDVFAASGLGVCKDGGSLGQSCSIDQPTNDTIYQTKVKETANLVSYWPFDASWADTQAANNLTAVGGQGFGEAKYGSSSAKFSGNIARYAMKNPFVGPPVTQATAEFWIRTSDTTKTAGLVSYSSPVRDNDFLVYNQQSISPHMAGGSLSSGVSVADGAWHHVAVTWQSVGGVTKVYKDGVEKFSGVMAAGSSIGAGGSLAVGTEQDCVGGCFDPAQLLIGELDEVAVYNRALTATEIADHYNNSILTASMCVPDNGLCQSGLSCDPTSCTCQTTITPINPPCDANNTNNTPVMQCDPDVTMCPDPINQVCDPTSCTCLSNAGAGDLCQDAGNPSCTVGVDACGVDYSCLDQAGADCRCCCTPGSTNAAGLKCVEDIAPCSTATRGLFCGCTADAECGNPTIDACGNDTCCRTRPNVATTTPGSNQAAVCRNPMIEVKFDQPMDVNSFSGNVILVGDYGASVCPANTTFLTAVPRQGGFLARSWNKIKTFFGGTATALVGNFCAVIGTTAGYNDPTTGDGVLTFSTQQLLDPLRDYYVVIKGDASSTDGVREGVLSQFGIAMDATLAPTLIALNAVNYHGYNWKFTTKPSTAADNGVCKFDKIELVPPSYTFTKAAATTSIVAFPETSDGTKVVPAAAVYDWNWTWLSEDTTVVNVSNTNNPLQTVTAGNKKDARTYVDVQAKILNDTINHPSTKDQTRTTKALMRLFICANPWPPMANQVTWPWQDAAGNCSAGLTGAGCDNYNFEFYYCRDGQASKAPALPSIQNSSSTPIRGSYNNILKEYFFLRAGSPAVMGGLATATPAVGGQIVLTWFTSGADGYKVYYGTQPGKYDNYFDVGNTGFALIPNLTNGKKYYFTVKAYSRAVGGVATGAESEYWGEVWGIPKDTLAPPLPLNLKLEPTPSTIVVKWASNPADIFKDTNKYKVYFGTAAGVYGQSFDVGKSLQSTLTGLSKGVQYYITVTALDAAGNESSKAANELSTTTPMF
jgi:hypothetical protein